MPRRRRTVEVGGSAQRRTLRVVAVRSGEVERGNGSWCAGPGRERQVREEKGPRSGLWKLIGHFFGYQQLVVSDGCITYFWRTSRNPESNQLGSCLDSWE